MNFTILLVLLGTPIGSVADPIGDVYLPGDPGSAAMGTIPDLVSGTATLDAGNDELRFDFTFTEAVYPRDDLDFNHLENLLYAYVDIDLHVPPINPGNSKKSEQSGFLSGLGIEAYVDLGLVSAGWAPLFDPIGNLLDLVPVLFDGSAVTITVPFTNLGGSAPDNEVAYAAYFTDVFQGTADVFPNGDGYALTPEPTTGAILALALSGWLARRPRQLHKQRWS